MSSICGIDCNQCPMGETCGGCAETGGRPFGADCIAALYCQKGDDALTAFKEKLLAAVNALPLPDREEADQLYPLKGSFFNIAYTLPGGQTVKFWDDNRIYLGTQLRKTGSDRCYGVAADETYLMVSEYGPDGIDPEIVVFQRWKTA